MQPGQMRQGTTAQQPAKSKSNETYSIVEVDKQLQVVSKPKELNDLKKRLDQEYKDATKAYNEAKKNKSTNGVKLEKPEKKTVKEIKSGIKGQDKAQEELQKLQAERAKGGRKSSR